MAHPATFDIVRKHDHLAGPGARCCSTRNEMAMHLMHVDKRRQEVRVEQVTLRGGKSCVY